MPNRMSQSQWMSIASIDIHGFAVVFNSSFRISQITFDLPQADERTCKQLLVVASATQFERLRENLPRLGEMTVSACLVSRSN